MFGNKKSSRKKSLLLFVVVTLLFVLAGSFVLSDFEKTEEGYTAPPQDFKKEWKTVDSLNKAGLPRSALEIVEKIYLEAKKQENLPHFIKAILYEIKLNADFQENAILFPIQDVKAEIIQADQPARQILQSILAELYWRYYLSNRYKIHERTTIHSSITNDDPETWDLKTLVSKVVYHYQASLDQSDILQATGIEQFKVILETTEQSDIFRPTLYDFLSHRAVDFFMNNEPEIIRPAEHFEIDNQEYFAPSSFIQLKLETEDSLSLKFYALKIFQDLAKFHRNDKKADALVDSELKRLEFVYKHAIVESKDKLYLDALYDIEKANMSQAAAAEASYQIAKHLFYLGNKYNPSESEEYRWELQKALKKCDETVTRFPGSVGANNCIALKEQILNPSLKTEMKEVTSPGKFQPVLLEFRNVSKVYCKIIEVDHGNFIDLLRESKKNEEILLQFINNTPKYTWNINLSEINDYQNHSTEIKIPGLPKGFYFLICSTSPEFDPKNGLAVYNPSWISDISLITKKDN
ncbi:MAG: hypothetical protein K8R53_13680, partial [Bacteroidales bacterium]|nr:hypothetical protein [Bacteroidales bacterium]